MLLRLDFWMQTYLDPLSRSCLAWMSNLCLTTGTKWFLFRALASPASPWVSSSTQRLQSYGADLW